MRGSSWLVVLAAAVSIAACSDAKSIVGVDEEDEEKIASEVPPATPTPPAPPAPTSQGSGGGSTASSIDLNAVKWLHTNVSGWAETSRITSVSIGNPPICIEHTKAGRWPAKNGLEGNPWIFVNLNGQWYAATYEWLASGQTCKGIHAGNIGEHIGVPPLASWRPRSGELVGFMVSARARAGGDTVAERSNVVMIRWP